MPKLVSLTHEMNFHDSLGSSNTAH